MTSVTKWLLCVFLAMRSVMAIAESSDMELLAKYRKIYDDAIAGYETEYRIEMQVWPVDYIKSLKELQIEHQTSGDLDGWELVNEELIRFRREPTFKDSKGPVAALQEPFRERATRARTSRSTKRADLTEKYVARLTALQREWTQNGKFDAAFAVRDEIRRVGVNEVASQEESNAGDDTDKLEGQPETPPTPPDIVTHKDGTRVTPPGVAAPNRDDVKFRERRLFTSSRSPRAPLIDTTLWDFSDSDKSGMRHVRVAVRTTHSGNPMTNLRLNIQYYSKPSGSSGNPRLVTTKQIPIELLETRPVFVDVAPVSNATLSPTVRRLRTRPIEFKFYGYVVTLLDSDNAALYEAATVSALGNRVSASASASKETKPRLSGRPSRVKRFGK